MVDIYKVAKLQPEFDNYFQAGLDEMVLEYLLFLSEERDCTILEIPEYIDLGDLRFMIEVYAREIQTIWKERYDI